MHVVIGRYKIAEEDKDKEEQVVGLNGLEYIIYGGDNCLGRPVGEVILFHSKESAMDILREDGMPEEEINKCLFIKINTVVCPKCGHKISIQEDESATCACGFHTDKVNLYELEFDIHGEVL